MKQREIKFRAMFKDMDSGKNAWITIGVNERYDQPGWSQVSPWVEFTGLLDKNGKEIYEGDVVRCVNDHVGVVEWEEHDCCFNVDGYYSGIDDYPTMAFIEGQPFEVIGNIYENPELLTP